ncbi:uncharacterized protein BCR38DRAFT_442421 [Pseudomassariella vexata]|uniref:Uncharacterized protein n=1 Tax=Pseudomassariella vexata TaxID=1141098 RepID=A0A1Y2DNC6_9PEZI|nr:uncharacterized protein BCR38DRAFT_442421 [Pseudomassariella vexata]ORY60761.1 hypothetical protein BCR38DRAFT_442421 [Pseudomassariella vexata]
MSFCSVIMSCWTFFTCVLVKPLLLNLLVLNFPYSLHLLCIFSGVEIQHRLGLDGDHITLIRPYIYYTPLAHSYPVSRHSLSLVQ